MNALIKKTHSIIKTNFLYSSFCLHVLCSEVDKKPLLVTNIWSELKSNAYGVVKTLMPTTVVTEVLPDAIASNVSINKICLSKS